MAIKPERNPSVNSRSTRTVASKRTTAPTLPADDVLDRWRCRRFNALDGDPDDEPIKADGRGLTSWPTARSTWKEIRDRLLVAVEQIDRGFAKGATFDDMEKMAEGAKELDRMFGVVDGGERPRWTDDLTYVLSEGPESILLRGRPTDAERAEAKAARKELLRRRKEIAVEREQDQRIDAARTALLDALTGAHPAVIGRTVAAVLDVPTPHSFHARGDVARGMALAFDEIALERHRAAQQAVEEDREERKGVRQ